MKKLITIALCSVLIAACGQDDSPTNGISKIEITVANTCPDQIAMTVVYLEGIPLEPTEPIRGGQEQVFEYLCSPGDLMCIGGTIDQEPFGLGLDGNGESTIENCTRCGVFQTALFEVGC